jgi:hypothetical protein
VLLKARAFISLLRSGGFCEKLEVSIVTQSIKIVSQLLLFTKSTKNRDQCKKLVLYQGQSADFPASNDTDTFVTFCRSFFDRSFKN